MNRLDLIIDALEKAKDGWQCFDEYEQALAAARELRELKPVAWMVLTQDDKKLMLYGEEKPPIFDAPVKLVPLYTAPLSKPWVGLTDDEINDFDKKLRDNGDYCSLHFAWGISAKLKEKNNAV